MDIKPEDIFNKSLSKKDKGQNKFVLPLYVTLEMFSGMNK